jgi:hypothetical protein
VDVGLQQVLFQLVEEQKDFPQDRLEATLSREENQRKLTCDLRQSWGDFLMDYDK